jgi:ADP-heptose:LPS heptosyltransferase
MKKKILVIIGARGIGDLIYHLPLLRSLHQSYKKKIIILSNRVNQAKEVYKNEIFHEKIINFDNHRYGFFKTLINLIKFRNLINSLNVSHLILTANYRRLVIPALLSNPSKKNIFGISNFKITKDRTLNHLTISERLLSYTQNLNLPIKVNNFFLNSPKLKKLKKKVKKKIFISIDSHHDQNNWSIKNYFEIINNLKKNNILYINFAPKKKIFLKYFKKEKLKTKNIYFTHNKKISDLIEIIKNCDHIVGNESGPICLGSSLKKQVHAIYLPIHTRPESKIIYKKNKYYNTEKISDKKIIKEIISSIKN